MRRDLIKLALPGLALGILLLGGCYTRVVEADESYDGTLYEPNIDDKEQEKVKYLD